MDMRRKLRKWTREMNFPTARKIPNVKFLLLILQKIQWTFNLTLQCWVRLISIPAFFQIIAKSSRKMFGKTRRTFNIISLVYHAVAVFLQHKTSKRKLMNSLSHSFVNYFTLKTWLERNLKSQNYIETSSSQLESK